MARPYTISGIDIGNSRIKVVVAQVNRETMRPQIIGAGTAPSNGLRRGMVVDMEETIENIRTAVQQAETMSGVQIRRAYAAVNGLHIRTQSSHGVIAVSRADNEISQHDIDRVIQAASVVSLPPNREIIHVIPRGYIVDGVEHVKNPLGMKGVRLEVDAFLIDGLSPYLRNIAKCINENGIEVSELVYAPLAASLAVLDRGQKEYGVLHLDVGGGVSTCAIFEESDLIHTAVLPVGSRHITNDLAVALRTSLDVAEQVKLAYGATMHGEDARKREVIDLSDLVGEENFAVPKKQLLKVVEARTTEVLDLVSAQLKLASRNGMLPAGVVLSGGGAKLPGIVQLTKDRLKLPARLARAVNADGVAEIINDPANAVAIGLVMWGLGEEAGRVKTKGGLMIQGDSVFKKATDWLKNFLP